MFDPKFRSNIDQLFPSFLDSLGDWIHVIDKKYRIIQINKSFQDINQKLHLPTEVLGKNLFDVYPFIKNPTFAEYESVFRTKQPVITDNSVTLDGKLIYNHTEKWPLLINDNVEYIITLVKDTTENVMQLEREKQANILKKIILNFSANLLNSDPSEQPILILDALKEIAFFLKAERTYIYNYHSDRQNISLFKEFCQEGCELDENVGREIQIADIPLFWQELQQDGYVCFLSGENYPSDVNTEKNKFQENPNLSLIAIGFFQNDQIHGFLGLDVSFNSVDWFKDNLTDLKLAANIFSNYFAHAEILRENQKLERQLLQAQRIESIGRLAGGIAHDFNNVLTSIVGNVSLAMMDLEHFPTNPVYLHEYLSEIKKSVDSASSLTKQLLTFSRQQSAELKVINLNTILQNLEKMIQRLIREDIELRLNLDPKLANIIADAGQIEQIMINLVVNARDAMEKGGKLLISTQNQEIEERDPQNPRSPINKQMVCLNITDTGCGMDDHVKSHLFEPFFTTKPKEKGTGLGLTIVYALTQKNNGKITVYSELGHGTSIKLMFPAIFAEEATSNSVSNNLAIDKNRHFRIILVEDEAAVRNTIKQNLVRLGYEVSDFSNGENALQSFNGNPTAPDLIISDLIMPVMNGRDFAQFTKKLFPEIPFIFISGYTADLMNENGLMGQQDAFLSKPFTIEKLDQLIQVILKDKQIAKSK